jgi:serine/threonine-protein kinase
MVSPSNKSSLDSDALRQAPTVEGERSHFYPGQVVGPRYKILKRLGRGGMGEVWHAYDLKLRVDVALKSVRRSTSDSIEALRGEVRAAREVVSPNVCRIFDLVAEEGQEFVSMEYIDGQTLLELLRVNSPLELLEAGEIALQFLAGLEAIHQAGLVHRDLKPENIMISQAGRVVVMDFGIAEHLADVSTTISGSPPYMSPEQHHGENVDARSDVFAAGVVLAEMFVKILQNYRTLHGNP